MESAFDAIVICRCGHPVNDHHAVEGCAGERGRRCSCTLDRHDVIEQAVLAAQSWPTQPANGT